jgi:hypothetical protein
MPTHFLESRLNDRKFSVRALFFKARCTEAETQFVRNRDPGIVEHLFVESGRDKCGVVATKTERVT